MRAMKDSGIEWIGEIPNHWSVGKNKRFFYEIIERSYDDQGCNLLSVSEYYGVGLRKEKMGQDEYLSRAESLEGYKKCRKDDLVFNIMLAWKSALGVSGYNGIVSPAYCVYRKVDETVNVKYFHYLFRTDMYANLFKRYSTGIIDSRLRLYPEAFLDLFSHLPQREEQQRIADYLDNKCIQIDSIIEKQKLVIEKLKQYKQSLITEAVTKGLDPTVEMKPSGIEWIGDIPAHWKISRIKNYIKKITDGAHISPETDDGIFDFVSVTDIIEDKINFTECLKTSQKSYEIFVRTGCQPRKNDVLLSKDGTVGKSVVVEGNYDFVVASSLIIIAPLPMLDCYFLNYLLKSRLIQEQLQFFLKGTGLKRVSVINASKLMGVFPAIEEQQLLVKYLDSKCPQIDNIIDGKQKTIDKLTAYKKSLIYECVTGKREVV